MKNRKNRMRKFLTLLLTVLLATALALPAWAEEKQVNPGVPLVMQELQMWFNDVWQNTKGQPLLNTPQETYDEQTGLYLLQYEDVTLECTAPTLEGTENPIETVTLNNGEVLGPRGLGLGASLEEVLLAYPSGNVPLAGDEEFAALYVYGVGEISGLNEAGWAWVLRDRAQVLSVQYAVHAVYGNEGTYTDAGIRYIIADGYVADMQVYGQHSSIDQQELDANLETLRDITGRKTYTPTADERDRQRAEMFGLSDLNFDNFDFLSATLESVTQRFGQPQKQDKIAGEDGDYGSLSCTYPNMELTFTLDAMGNPLALQSMLIRSAAQPGPRDLRIGDDLAEALAKFRQEERPGQNEQVILYAAGATLESPPFGVVDYYGAAGATVRYATPVAPDQSSEAVMLHLTIDNMQISEILLYRWTVDAQQ